MVARVAAVRQAWTRRAIAERRRLLSRTGGCCWGCGGVAANPRMMYAATGASGRGTEAAATFQGRGRATAARGDRRVGIRYCWFEAMVVYCAHLTLSKPLGSWAKNTCFL